MSRIAYVKGSVFQQLKRSSAPRELLLCATPTEVFLFAEIHGHLQRSAFGKRLQYYVSTVKKEVSVRVKKKQLKIEPWFHNLTICALPPLQNDAITCLTGKGVYNQSQGQQLCLFQLVRLFSTFVLKCDSEGEWYVFLHPPQ